MATPSTGQSGMTATAVQLPPERPEYVGDIIGGGIGIYGALAGAYAAYRWGLKAARDAKASEKKARNQQIDFSLIHKLNKIYAAQQSIRKAADEGAARLTLAREAAAREGRPFLDHLSLEMRPFATSLTRYIFTPEEVARAGQLGGQEIMKTMMVIDDRHNTTAELLDTYRDQKAAFQGIVQAGTAFDPQRGYMQFRWSGEDYAKYQPHLFTMDASATALRLHSSLDESAAYDVIVAVAKANAKEQGEKADIRITMPNGGTLRITSAGEEILPEKRQ